MNILYTRFADELTPIAWTGYLKQLPRPLQEKIMQYRRWQDRHAHLFGKLLLREAVKMCTGTDDISRLKYSTYGRPYLDQSIDFNLSHSGQYVVCAISAESTVGVDIEEIKPVQLSDFDGILRPDEMAVIRESPDTMQSFYRLWTVKESVIKAEGRGLSIPLGDIQVDIHSATLYNKVWRLHNLSLNNQYSACLTTNEVPQSVHVREVHFY